MYCHCFCISFLPQGPFFSSTLPAVVHRWPAALSVGAGLLCSWVSWYFRKASSLRGNSELYARTRQAGFTWRKQKRTWLLSSRPWTMRRALLWNQNPHGKSQFSQVHFVCTEEEFACSGWSHTPAASALSVRTCTGRLGCRVLVSLTILYLAPQLDPGFGNPQL